MLKYILGGGIIGTIVALCGYQVTTIKGALILAGCDILWIAICIMYDNLKDKMEK